MRRLIRGAVAALVLAAAGSRPATAAELPLPRMELGVGVGLLSNPDYSGSASVATTVLPVPYFAYRGERIQLSRDGLVARLFNTPNLRVGVSASATLPGNESQQSARRGMPRLLPTFEFGPSLEWHLGDAGGRWDLRLPVRAVAAADFDEFERIGWLSYPHLRVDQGLLLGTWTVEGAASAGTLWGSREYHRYFYRVEPRYATLQRPAYDPAGGYSGARATVFIGLRHNAWRLGLGISHDVLSGATWRDSPLVETGQATTVALGVFYTLWKREWERAPPAELLAAP